MSIKRNMILEAELKVYLEERHEALSKETKKMLGLDRRGMMGDAARVYLRFTWAWEFIVEKIRFLEREFARLGRLKNGRTGKKKPEVD